MPPAGPKSTAPEQVQAEINLGVLNDVIGFRIRRIQNHLSRSFAERAGQDIRPGLFSALALIAANPGLSQTRLSREIGFDKATVVALLDSLERLGWAERRRSPDDRRRHSLYISKVGEKSLAQLLDVAIANEAGIREVLTGKEQAQLFSLLDKIYIACFPDDPT
jgi:DNA-binding MarR family transcriptional regulator